LLWLFLVWQPCLLSLKLTLMLTLVLILIITTLDMVLVMAGMVVTTAPMAMDISGEERRGKLRPNQLLKLTQKPKLMPIMDTMATV